MKNLNPQHLMELLELVNKGPYFQLLSMRISSLAFGYCRLEVNVDKKHLNPFGLLHGGVYASILDTVTYWSLYCEMPEESGLITLDNSVDYLHSVKGGKLIAEGKRIYAGRRICTAEATVMDEYSKLLAHGKSKQMVVNGMQTIGYAVESMGYKPLPPKFL